MKNIKRTLYPFALLFIASCVTINVYFPAAAAQEAADEIVNEVLKQTPKQGNQNNKPDSTETKTSKPSAFLHQTDLFLIAKVLDFIIPTAQAGANLSINTPKIRSIRNQLKQQHSHLVPFFNKGNIGYADNGLIKVRNTTGLNIKQKSSMTKQMNTSNDLLSNLYNEIAKANGHPEWKGDIQKTFAKTWVNQMQGGWMYYHGGQWKKK